MRSLALILAALALTGCAGTQAERQESADQKFGQAKLALVAASGVVGVYNVLCNDALATSSICTKEVSDYINDGLAGASDAVESAEKVFAAANTDQDARLKAANIAVVVVAELTKGLAKYGASRLKGA
jgi:hypothetical protein